MIVTMGDKKLWVEGDKAYSVEDIQYKHELLNKNKSDLECEIAKETDIINEHTAIKNEATSKLNDVNSELEGVEFIYNKIVSAEATPKSEEVIETPVIVVDQTKDQELEELPITEEVEAVSEEVKIVDEEPLVEESVNETTEDPAESIIFNEAEVNSQPMTSHRRFRV